MRMFNIFAAAILAGATSIIAAPVESQTLRVRALVFQPGFPDELHVHNASGTATAGLIQVKSYLNHESNQLDIKSNQLVFTSKFSPSSATDVHQVLGRLELPPKLKSAVLLFLPKSQAADDHKCDVVAVDDGAEAFPAGSFKVINMSEVPIKLDLSGEVTEMAPGEIKVLSNIKFDETQAVSMRAYSKRGDDWTLISTSSWTNPGTKRVLQVIYKDLATNEVQLKGVRDVGAN